MSDSHHLAYQRGFRTIRDIWSTWWGKWCEHDVSECLKGCSSGGERSDTWSSKDAAMWTDAWKHSWVDTWDMAPIVVTIEVVIVV